MVSMNSVEQILAVVMLAEVTLDTAWLARPQTVEEIIHTALELSQLSLQTTSEHYRGREGGRYLV